MLKITTKTIIAMKKKGEKITALTAYDFPTAKILDSCGIEIILIGDSAANVIYGYSTTLPIGMEEMLYHTKAVSLGIKQGLIVADMPFLSYQTTIGKAVENAGKFLKAGAEAVKLEGGEPILKTVERLVKLGIPVMGHLGLTPQSVHKFGGYKLQAKIQTEQDKLLSDALALESAGCFSLVLEKIPMQFAKTVTEKLSIPTIGIGAGPYCDGQILVLHDILGIFPESPFRFVKQFTNLHKIITEAVRQYIKEVKTGAFPDKEHSFPEEEVK